MVGEGGPAARKQRELRYIVALPYILSGVSKHLVDLDDDALARARAELGTATIKETVNQALRQAAGDRASRVAEALDTLAGAGLEDRDRAWR